MRKLIFTLTAALFSLTSYAQIEKPVTWSYAAKKTSATEAIIYLKATIEDGWHLYSQFVKAGGPVKTTITFDKSPLFTLVDKTTEPKPITKFESTFNMNVSYFEKSVIFQQKVKLKGKTALVKGKLEFMVCDDHQCLPPEEIAFSVSIK
ncbi:protein-disulfide reductase DsbD domain-containing protein [Pedobacter insulae]|uniref:Disulphide bond corrector protein DsbC n=1 Tax=Pedobacter insulae TaxID=414048 RepID=A0A1I2YLU4_9SPHI|nr:protein-disulfide reductase DsbD domain-containing protein [Pedobacter insulae]SFH26605.1 Disulphide bond corrector protein DsbC [Pedobacter insulae]